MFSICDDNAVIWPWIYANWSTVCHTWDSSMPYIYSILARRWSRWSGPRACACEDGCAEPSGVEVNLSISSSVSPSSSLTSSLGIWETPVLDPIIGHGIGTNGIVSWYNCKTTWNIQSCLCNETHNETREWHDCPWIPFGDTLGQEVEYVSTYVNLFICVEIIKENGSWSR